MKKAPERQKREKRNINLELVRSRDKAEGGPSSLELWTSAVRLRATPDRNPEPRRPDSPVIPSTSTLHPQPTICHCAGLGILSHATAAAFQVRSRLSFLGQGRSKPRWLRQLSRSTHPPKKPLLERKHADHLLADSRRRSYTNPLMREQRYLLH